jgi:hypothetical protein
MRTHLYPHQKEKQYGKNRGFFLKKKERVEKKRRGLEKKEGV